MTLFQAKKAARRIIDATNGKDVPSYASGEHNLLTDGIFLATYLLNLLDQPEKIDALMLADKIISDRKGVV